MRSKRLVDTDADAQGRTEGLAYHSVLRIVGFGGGYPGWYFVGQHHHFLWRKAAAS